MKYINPPQRVQEEGRRVELLDTLPETRSQLTGSEVLVLIHERPHGPAAIIPRDDREFDAARISHLGISGVYGVGAALASTAKPGIQRR